MNDHETLQFALITSAKRSAERRMRNDAMASLVWPCGWAVGYIAWWAFWLAI